MKRREFITLLGGAAAAWPIAAHGQQAGKIVRIGILGPSLKDPFPMVLHQAFLAQLRELGFVEGQNLIAEYQALDEPRGPFAAAAELMQSQPDLVVAAGPEVALQAVVGRAEAFRSSSSPSIMIRSREAMWPAFRGPAATLRE
jgi:putative tryptophan/tyrosine transport system substrate-binding protein